MMKNTLLISCAILLLVACKDKVVKEGESTIAQDTISNKLDSTDKDSYNDTILYETKGFNKKTKNCANESTNCASFEASFPVINTNEHGKTADAINNFIRAKLYTPLIGDEQPNGLNSLLRPYFDAYNEALQTHQNEGEDSIQAWSFKRYFKVQNNSAKLFTVAHKEHSYAGGAHPNHFTNYYHFNPKSGKQLLLGDFFKEGFDKKLTAIAEKQFRSAQGLSANTKLVDEGYWFKNKVFQLTENFFFGEKLVFIYNPYEVASYAVGTIKVEVDYNTIEDLLKEDYSPNNQTLIN